MSIILTFDAEEYNVFSNNKSGYFFNPFTGKIMTTEEKIALYVDFIEAAEEALILFANGRSFSSVKTANKTPLYATLLRCCLYVLKEHEYFINFSTDESSENCAPIEMLDRKVFPVYDELFDDVSGERDQQFFIDTTGAKKIAIYAVCEDDSDAGILFNFYSEGI